MPNRLSQFWQDLKRRKVTRLATVYTVVGLGIIETTDIIGGRFQFPDWTVRLIIIIVFAGFPIAMVLGWIFDITSRGIERTKSLTPEEKSQLPSLTWKPSWISVLLFIALISISTAFFVVPRANALGFQKRDWILVADLENNTGEDIFDQSLMHALTITIDQSRYVNVFPRKRVMEVLQRMKMDNVDRIDVPLSLEIAERENIKSVLALSISELDGTYLLSTSLLDPITGETVRSRQVKANGRDKILQELDKLATSVRRDLGESLNQVVGRRVPLPKATTPSLEALKLYSDGTLAFENGQWKEARTLWTHAIELDSGFAWANASLGLLEEYYGSEDMAREYYNRALSQLDRVTEKERLWIMAITKNGPEAIDAYQAFLQQFPDTRNGWYNLGNCLRIEHRFEEAIEAYQNALIIDPRDTWTLENLGVLYDALGQIDKAADHFEKAFQINPEEEKRWLGNVNRISGFVLVKLGDTARARERFEILLGMEEGARANGLSSLALLDMYQGHHNNATALLNQAIVYNQHADLPLREFESRMYLAKAYQTMGRDDLLAGELTIGQKLAEENGFAPGWIIRLAILQAQSGDLESARYWLNKWSGSQNGTSNKEREVEFLRGEIALAEGNLPESIAAFERAKQLNLNESGILNDALGRAYQANGEPEKAIEAFTRLIQLMPPGYEPQEPWVLAHYRLGLLFEEIGDREQSQHYLTRFLELWGSGDLGLLGVDDARRRLQ